MFEFQFALRYLIPRKKSLSLSLVSLVSIFVISLVVWLVLIFLSVTSGIENNWLTKLTSLNAPIRITPTEQYYSSYYHQIDQYASASNYLPKTIGEKALSEDSNPFDSSNDMHPPLYLPSPQMDQDGLLLDPVKKLYDLLGKEKAITFQDYEISGALLRLNLVRQEENPFTGFVEEKTSNLTQMNYLLSLNDENPNLRNLLIAPSEDHITASLLSNHPGYQQTLKDAKTDEKLTLENFPEEIDQISIGVFLPKALLDTGVKIGDKGHLSFAATSTTSTQEQKIAIFVRGFFDPGILPVSNKAILVPHEITQSINATTNTFSPDGTPTNGIYVWTKNITDASNLKEALKDKLSAAGIEDYWTVTTYHDYEFSKDLMEQFQSDRTLFTLIAIVILIVACSNIASFLILLVNDKKKEMAILQAMGAKPKSIVMIFGLCGLCTGLFSSLLGTVGAIFALKHLPFLISILSSIQGHTPFNPAFFGNTLPNQLSMDALIFIAIATPIISVIAGLIPAIKASKIHPSSTLRYDQ